MNKQVSSGLAIGGFVVLLLSVFIPIYGLYIGGMALGLVAVGGYFGERVFTILTVVVSIVKVWFLSPTFYLLSNNTSDGGVVIFIAVIAHAIPIVAILMGKSRISELKKEYAEPEQ